MKIQETVNQRRTRLFLEACAEENYEVFACNYNEGYAGFKIGENDTRLFRITEELKSRYQDNVLAVFKKSETDNFDGVVFYYRGLDDFIDKEEFMESIKDLISSRVVDFVGPSEMMEAIASKYRKVAKDIYYFEDGVSGNYIFQFFGARVKPEIFREYLNDGLRPGMYGKPDYQIILDGPRTLKNFLYDSYQDKSMIDQKKKKTFKKEKSPKI